jgi:nucleoside-triphosphatase THEP1
VEHLPHYTVIATNMKILVTAPPKTGKSTLICRVIEALQKSGTKDCRGVLSTEKLDCTGITREGFTAVLSDGRSKEFMIKENHESVGHPCPESKMVAMIGTYQVKVDIIEEFVVPFLKKSEEEGNNTEDGLIYIDEIGRAQAFSSEFLATVGDIFLHSTQCVLASIVFEDEAWSQSFKAYEFVWLVEVTEENRSFLPCILEAMYTHDHLFKQLSEDGQKLVKTIFFELLELKMFNAAKKLFSNAIKYILEGKIVVQGVKTQQESGADDGDCEMRCFVVKGDTNTHEVHVKENKCDREQNGSSAPPHDFLTRTGQANSVILCCMDRFSCDCPLFNGTAPFSGRQQVCSHIVAICITLWAG